MARRKICFTLLACLVLVSVILIGHWSNVRGAAAGEPATFSTYEELSRYIEQNQKMARYFRVWAAGPEMLTGNPVMLEQKGDEVAKSAPAVRDSEAPGYSETNNQVQGVDEADVVKTDGTHLYVISGNQLSILQAYPAEQAKVLSKIKLAGRPLEIFVHQDTLVIFGEGDPGKMYMIKYTIADRTKPVVKQRFDCEGRYVTSRMINGTVYAIMNAPVIKEAGVILPVMTRNDQPVATSPAEIHYFGDADFTFHYTIVLSLNLQDESEELQKKVFLTGTSHNIYASQNNLYLTGPKMPDYAKRINQLIEEFAVLMPGEVSKQIQLIKNSKTNPGEQFDKLITLLEDYFSRQPVSRNLEEKAAEVMRNWQRGLTQESDFTVIYKLAIENGQVHYRARGEVKGQLLNQFSMDEHQGFFRIATTSRGNRFTGITETRNNIYVLDQHLQRAGEVTGLAPTERIYAARFMGERAYLVTFRNIDPLFVVDMKDPYRPKVLGELKIPGYSDYLHPYDENHLLGIGREVSLDPVPLPGLPEIMPPRTRVQGIKIALFDVSNPTAPKEVAKYVFDQDDSDSPALRDHRAVLFSREKNLLALPIQQMPFRTMEWPGKPVDREWQGVYVFNLSPETGIKLKGKVEHPAQRGNYNPAKRSLYIGDHLYSVSEQLVKINLLHNLQEIKQLPLN